MLMTVHDEIVFEVRDDRVPEVLPVLVEIMESPSTLAGWGVPLIVEPLLGRAWNAKYDWLEIQKGEAELPDWLKPHFEAYEKKQGIVQPKPTLPEVKSPAPKVSANDATLAPKSSDQAPSKSSAKSQIAVFAVASSFLTKQSIRLVMKAIAGAAPIGDDVLDKKRYKKLRLVESAGKVLIDSNLGIMIDPDEFGRGLKEANLGFGSYDLADET
jgi:hypothetical protein